MTAETALAIARHHVRSGRLAHAAPIYQRLAVERPESADILEEAGQVALKRGSYPSAASLLGRALEADPSRTRLRQDLAKARFQAGDLDGCAALVEAMMAERPDDRELIDQMAQVYSAKGQAERALEWEMRLLALHPDDASARLRRGRHLLFLGRTAEAWPDHAARNRFWPARHPAPAWDGSPLAGRRVAVLPEPSPEETLVFARFLPEIARRGGRAVLCCDPSLVGVLKLLPDLDDVAASDSVPEADLSVRIGDLPGLLGADIPPPPYLQGSMILEARWRARLAGDERPAVGLSWVTERPTASGSDAGGFRFDFLLPLLEAGGVRFVALDPLPTGFSPEMIEPAGPEVTDAADRTALLASLDLVISVDNLSAHLAAGLGRPTWALLPLDPEWWWGDAAAWYPAVRRFRPAHPRDWTGVLAEVATALDDWRVNR